MKTRTMFKGDEIKKIPADDDAQREELIGQGWKPIQYGSWVITKDYIGPSLTSIDSPDEKGICGPSTCNMTEKEIRKFGKKFKMYDDDGELYYDGYCVVRNGIGVEGFRPLDDFGTPNAGATEIRYKNDKGEWRTL